MIKPLFPLLFVSALLLSCSNTHKLNTSDKTIPTGATLKKTGDCNTLMKIDSEEFEHYLIKGDTAVPAPEFKKVRGILTIPKTEYTFEDDLNEAEYIEYYPKGRLKDWYVVLSQDYNQNYYFLINPVTNTQDELVGNPKLFGKYMVCIEDEHTDSPVTIEIYNINSGKLQLINKMSLSQCNLWAITDFYLTKDHVYLKHYEQSQPGQSFNYYKFKIH